jgi:hypothetical protein
VRLSVQDRVAVGGGRLYTVAVQSSSLGSLKYRHHPMHEVQSALVKSRSPSYTTCSAMAQRLTFWLHASLSVPVYCTRSSNSLFTHVPFAKKSCRLSDVLQRFQVPTIDLLRASCSGERRENEAAYGEQIQQKCHRVERCSGRAEAPATLHPVCWSSSEEHWHHPAPGPGTRLLI